MNRTTNPSPKLPTRSIRLKTAGYRRRWKAAGREIRFPEAPVRIEAPVPCAPAA